MLLEGAASASPWMQTCPESKDSCRLRGIFTLSLDNPYSPVTPNTTRSILLMLALLRSIASAVNSGLNVTSWIATRDPPVASLKSGLQVQLRGTLYEVGEQIIRTLPACQACAVRKSIFLAILVPFWHCAAPTCCRVEQSSSRVGLAPIVDQRLFMAERG